MNTIDLTAALGLTERSVTTCGERRVIQMRRTFATNVDDAWEACTHPDRLRRWLGTTEGDRREGGVVTVRMTDDPAEIATLTIVRCDAPRRLVVRWDWPDEPQSIVEMNLAPTAGGDTALTLRHSALAGQLPVAYGAGWEDFLVRLGWLLDGNEPAGVDTSSFVEQVTPIWTGLDGDARDDHQWPTVEPDGTGTVTARTRHEYDAPPATVWASITDASRLTAWMAPVSGNLAVDGSWKLAYDNGSALGTVRECEPPHRFVTTWGWDFQPDAPESTLTVALTPTASGGTLLELVHERMATPAEGYAAGWYAGTRVLDRYLAGEPLDDADWQADWATALAMIRP
jgi:uncharacterized protein YndB with AHSA1/START domain